MTERPPDSSSTGTGGGSLGLAIFAVLLFPLTALLTFIWVPMIVLAGWAVLLGARHLSEGHPYGRGMAAGGLILGCLVVVVGLLALALVLALGV